MGHPLSADLQNAWAVRVQDDWHGARIQDGELELMRPLDWKPVPSADISSMARETRRAQAAQMGYRFARDTFHFTLDGLVSDHAWGEFHGGIVILTPLAGLQNPMGLHRDDTWVHARADGSARCPGAVALAPEGWPVPPELAPFVRRYAAPDPGVDFEGFKAARQAATRDALAQAGRPYRDAGSAAIHMGSVSDAMESALDLFQAQLAAAIAHGPKAWAQDRLGVVDPSGFEPWMSMPQGPAAALAASREQRLEMIERLKNAEAAARRCEGMEPAAIERFSQRADLCRQALFEAAAELDRRAIEWGMDLSRQPSALAAPPPWPGSSENAYWDWLAPNMDALAAKTPHCSLASLEHLALHGGLGGSGAVVFVAMDGGLRARPAQELFPEAFAAAPVPPPLDEVDFAERLASRRLQGATPPSLPRPVAP